MPLAALIDVYQPIALFITAWEMTSGEVPIGEWFMVGGSLNAIWRPPAELQSSIHKGGVEGLAVKCSVV